MKAGVEPKVVLPMLSRANWQTEFRERFLEYALQMDEAGDILIRGVDQVMRPPDRNMRRLNADGQVGLSLIHISEPTRPY